jgi:hypothetical protein
LLPVAFAQEPLEIDSKDPGLRVLNGFPVSAELPAHLLDDFITPVERLFLRNNGRPPESVDVGAWSLTIDGEAVSTAKTFSLRQLQTEFATVQRGPTVPGTFSVRGVQRGPTVPDTFSVRGNGPTGSNGARHFLGTRWVDGHAAPRRCVEL